MEVIIGIAILIFLFLVFRAIVLWYWRVNEAIELLKKMDSKLGQLVDAQRGSEKTAPMP